jgi:hypothetical protein
MNEEQDIDKIFRQKLGEPVNDETSYREDDWDALEQLLDKGKKRRGIVYWMPFISSVAAILLIVLGWWLFKPQTTVDVQKPKKQLANIQLPKKQQPANSDELIAKNNATQPTITNMPQVHNNGSNTIQQPTQQAQLNNYVKNFGKKPVMIDNNIPGFKPPIVTPAQNAPSVDNVLPELAAVNTGLQINTTANRADVSTKNIITNDYAKSLAIKRNKVITTSSFSHPQYALTIMGAPDINGVNSFQQGKTGTNVGLLFSIGFNKLTVTTGASYSYKPYNTSFNNYLSSGYTYYKTNPLNVLADCRMLDIPLNIDYQLFNKNKNKISIGTGLSSYIMLKESYNYEYADPYAKGPRNYNIASPGKYFLSVLNLQATYKRQVNAKVGVSVQPYLKLPLGEVGASQVRLQSAGVAIGLSWNINSLTKP